MNKIKYYCYVGSSASTGQANQKTGLYSRYGDIIAFSTVAKRDKFVAEYYCGNFPNNLAIACNTTTARQYCLGMSVRAFKQYLDQLVVDVLL